MDLQPILASLERDGFAVVPRLLDPTAVNSLLSALRLDIDAEIYSSRDLLWTCPAIAALADCSEIRTPVGAALGNNALPVRGLFFDKVPEANWKVAWHQDLTIAVERRHDLPGFTAWSVKNGVPHVQRWLARRAALEACSKSGRINSAPPRATRQVVSAVRLRCNSISAGESLPWRCEPASTRKGPLSAVESSR